MKKIMAFIASMTLLALVIFASSGCSAGAVRAQKTFDNSQVIVALGPGNEPEAGFNPVNNWGSSEHMHEPLLQSTLITTDENLDFHNDLATEYSVSEDGLVWSFTIRDDVIFSDGEPLTANDVAFTINEIKASELAEADFTMIDSAKAVDDTHVEIALTRPYNALLYVLAVVGIVPEHAYDENYGMSPETTISSGRYILEQWDKGQQVIFKANPDYYGELANIERVVVVFMDDDAALAAAAAGEVDLAQTNVALAKSVPNGYSVLACKSVDSRGINLPVVAAGGKKDVDGESYEVGNDVTAQVEVRRAINMGIDRQRFVDVVLNGYGTPAYSVGTGMPWYNEAMEVNYDKEAAQKTLTDAGWEKGEEGIFAKDGMRCAFKVMYNASDSTRQAIALEFANQMKEIGIEVETEGKSWDELYPSKYTTPIVWGFGSNAPMEIESLYKTHGSFDVASYSNKVVDAYMEAALATSTVEDSFDNWKKAQWDGTTGVAPQADAPWVWIVNIDHLYFQREGLDTGVQKLQPHGHGWSTLNNVDTWTWAE